MRLKKEKIQWVARSIRFTRVENLKLIALSRKLGYSINTLIRMGLDKLFKEHGL